MATRTAKLRIELDGEKKYKEAIAEINRESKTLGAEMKKLAAEYKGNEDSIEALTKKQELLDRAFNEAAAKVEETRKALDSWRAALERVRQEQGASSDEYKQAQKKVQEYEAALANAETQEINLENAIRENNEALQDADKELDKTAQDSRTLGDQISDLAGKFGIKLPEGLKKSLDGMNAFSAGSVAALGAITTAVTVAYKAFQKLNDLTLEQAKAADELITRSVKTGLDTTLLQQLEYASSFLDFDGVDQSLQKLTQSMGKARDGAAAQAEAFAALGVSVTNADGSLRDSWDVFLETIDALGRMESEEEAAVIANDLLGKSYTDLKPLIAAGSDELRKFADEATEVGYVLDESQIKKLAEVDDAHEKTQKIIEATQKQIAAEFAPASKAAMETFGDAVQKAGQLLVDSHLIENAAAIVTQVMNIIDAASDFASLIPGWMNPIERLSNTLKGLAAVAAMVADALNAVSSLMRLDFNGVKTALGMNLSSGQMNNLQQLKYGDSWTHNGVGWDIAPSGSAGYDKSKGLYYDKNGNYMYNAAGSFNWRGGLTWVGESGPELVSLPQGSRIYNAQESRKMASPTVVATDLSQIEQLLGEVLSALRDKRVIGRMA